MTAPFHPHQHCGHEKVCVRFITGSRVAALDGTPCMANHEGCRKCIHDARIPKRHLITNTRTGKQYTTDLQQLCIDAGLSDRLTYCDIECLLTDGETWYMLDECGNWAYLPSVYKVEDVR